MTAWGIGSIAAPAGRTGVAACSAGESGERAPPAYGGTRAGFCRLDVRLLGVASGQGGQVIRWEARRLPIVCVA
jgi:hypothetical protein